MDNIAESGNSINKLTKIKHGLNQMLRIYGFEIKEWYINYKQLGTIVKSRVVVLGCEWNMESDRLSVNIQTFSHNSLTNKM